MFSTKVLNYLWKENTGIHRIVEDKPVSFSIGLPVEANRDSNEIGFQGRYVTNMQIIPKLNQTPLIIAIYRIKVDLLRI